MKILSLFILGMLTTISVHAQDIVEHLEQHTPGYGEVTVHQDPRIANLLGKVSVKSATPSASSANPLPDASTADSGEQKFLKAYGYRVQVYAGNNSRMARGEALNISAKVKEYFPDIPVYTHFSSPRWLCRVGDFKNIEEADAMMRKLRGTGIFKEVSIVKEQINIPL